MGQSRGGEKHPRPTLRSWEGAPRYLHWDLLPLLLLLLLILLLLQLPRQLQVAERRGVLSLLLLQGQGDHVILGGGAGQKEMGVLSTAGPNPAASPLR